MLITSLIFLLSSVPLFSYRITSLVFTRISCIILIYCIILTWNIFDINNISIQDNFSLYNGFFQVNGIQIIIEIFVYFIGAIVLCVYPINSKMNIKTEYSIIVIYAIIGQSLLISSFDIISIYLSLELQSFSVYILTSLYRESESAVNAGLKYFLLGGISSAIILLGNAIIYNFTGTTQFQEISIIIIDNYQNWNVYLGITLIGIGLLFKIGAAPMHHWAPDVYDGSPTLVTLFIITFPKISILVFILNNHFQDITVFHVLLWIAAYMSIIVGTVLGLNQFRLKRLLAYSTISHVGFIIVFLVVNNFQSIQGFLFYIIQYSLTNICIFICLINISYILYSNKDIELISSIQGIFYKIPLQSISIILCLINIAGIPPIIGFFGKIILLQGIQEYFYLGLCVCIVSVISASYYLRIIKVIFFSNTINNDSILEIEIKVSNIQSFIISIISLYIIVYIFDPEILLNIVEVLSLTIWNSLSKIKIFLIFIPILVVILLLVNLVLAVHRPDSEKVTPYECGFQPVYGQTRNPFSIQFYLVGILFLIFDLEILLVYPISASLYQVQSYGFWIFIEFFIVLTVGFIYEFGSGALYFTDHRHNTQKLFIIPFFEAKILIFFLSIFIFQNRISSFSFDFL